MNQCKGLTVAAQRWSFCLWLSSLCVYISHLARLGKTLNVQLSCVLHQPCVTVDNKNGIKILYTQSVLNAYQSRATSSYVFKCERCYVDVTTAQATWSFWFVVQVYVKSIRISYFKCLLYILLGDQLSASYYHT